MSQTLSELLELLIEEAYGELAANSYPILTHSEVVFSTLDHKGRLTLHGVINESGLNVRRSKHGLAILIQAHLAFHHTDDNETSYYEANRSGAYGLVRLGKAVTASEDRYGKGASEVIYNVALAGHVKIEELKHAFRQGNKKSNGSVTEVTQTNGHAEKLLRNGRTNGLHVDSNDQEVHVNGDTAELDDDILQLLKSEYILTVNSRHFISRPDMHFEAERKLLRSDNFRGGPRGVKDKAKFAAELRLLKRKWTEYEEDKTTSPSESPTSKRPMTVRPTTNGVKDIHSHTSARYAFLNDELIVRLNQDKITISIRTERLVDFAARYVGHVPSMVYKACLQLLERKQMRCFDEYEANVFDDEDQLAETRISVSSGEILEKLDPDIDLSKELPPDPKQSAEDGAADLSESDNDSDVDDVSPSDRDVDSLHTRHRLRQVERHMKIFCDDPRQFAMLYDNRRNGMWSVPFRKLSKNLVQQEIEDTIMSRWGSQAVRIVRLLHEKGKLEDRQISDDAMMKIKDVRLILRVMQEKGFVEIQEVPRDNGRQPNRSIYLWFFDQDRTRRVLLNETYQCMSRLIQRRDHEKAAIQPLLDKVDMIGPNDDKNKLLNKRALIALKTWDQKENKLLLQLARQDDVVAVLRDFLPDHK